MPTLQLKVSHAHTALPYNALAQALTHLSAQYLGKRADVTEVVIQEMPAGQWFVGGQPPQDRTAFLEINITEGTNTAAQKAAFIAAAFEELQRLIGAGRPLAPASYVVVHELPATDWGYGGKTQEARRGAARTDGP